MRIGDFMYQLTTFIIGLLFVFIGMVGLLSEVFGSIKNFRIDPSSRNIFRAAIYAFILSWGIISLG